MRRQGLIEPFADPMDAVRAMVAVQTQYAASLPVAVATRTKKPKPGWDDRALRPGGELIKSWSLRLTLHAHTVEDHDLVVGSLGPHLYPKYQSFMERRRSIEAVHELEARILEALDEKPLTRRELHDKVPELKSIDMVGWGLDVMGLALQRRLCIVGRGSDQKFCHIQHRDIEPDYGGLLIRYLSSYGPATKADFAFWTGYKTPQVTAAFNQAKNLIEPVEIEGYKGVRYSIVGQVTDEPVELGVRLLAKFDPLVLAHKDKALFIDPQFRKRVFRIAGQVEAVVLINGVAAGTWRMDRKAKRLDFTVEPFRKYGKREIGRIGKEAERIAKAVGVKQIDLQLV